MKRLSPIFKWNSELLEPSTLKLSKETLIGRSSAYGP